MATLNSRAWRNSGGAAVALIVVAVIVVMASLGSGVARASAAGAGQGTASVRDTAPQFGLAEIMAPGVTVYQTRDAYLAKTGKEAPECNPAIPAKYWSLDVPAGQSFVTITVPVVLPDGAAVAQTMTIPSSLARAVNIPKEKYAVGEAIPAEEMRFPIQALRQDEVLVNLLFGVQVRNTTRWLPMTDPVQNEILTLVRKIAQKLGIQ